MTKRHLTTTEAFDLRQALHVATLDALMASRRWEPGDLVFQGGTSLHLVHGSPRFSEDLDFLVNSSLKLSSISAAVEARLDGSPWLLPAGSRLTVSKAKEGHNPHSFVVGIGGPDLIGAVRVRVELWRVAEQPLLAVKTTVTPVRAVQGRAAGIQAFVPTADLSEIYADKVFALAARPYLKPRDVFDLHWLVAQGGRGECTLDDLQVRLATYPNETPSAWLEKAQLRRRELATSTAFIMQDLKRWLPSSWPLSESNVHAMQGTAIESLDQGMEMMQLIEEQTRCEDEGPSP